MENVYDSVTGKALLSEEEAQHTEPKKYEAVVEFLRDGYGERLLPVLMTCIERYMEALVSLDMCPGKRDTENMWYLCTMFMALLKDEHGIDLEK